MVSARRRQGVETVIRAARRTRPARLAGIAARRLSLYARSTSLGAPSWEFFVPWPIERPQKREVSTAHEELSLGPGSRCKRRCRQDYPKTASSALSEFSLVVLSSPGREIVFLPTSPYRSGYFFSSTDTFVSAFFLTTSSFFTLRSASCQNSIS